MTDGTSRARQADLSPEGGGSEIPTAQRPGVRGTPPSLFRRAGALERKALALPVLESALALIRSEGWCQGALVDRKGRVSLYGALARGTLESEFAREVLREMLRTVDLVRWNDRAERERREVVRALQRAVRLCRAAMPVHSGGWRVAPSSPTRNTSRTS